ncbi:MAG: hypothetical protein IJI50_01055 [Ruminococcus sp.]|nr:hypothetical protein [Ruminococcus sp.]
MKAAILEKYASDGRELVVRDIPIPAITDDEVLVKVVAAAVNPLDKIGAFAEYAAVRAAFPRSVFSS